ncbi:hypothetical protein ASPFODRAFT_530403 [Aspergillus luchuensis CBS 106.47]|uniref:Uncharacterized protein n=1 Tax=Aspergillus luchuensis (strain CBS 106.47) TaxID=1137211 RepID=A0A1M3TMW2_ASPLC|nr:hypothetical protein ASPFODRAFT_530403 [Aspergillus luchuensis CBS 106.47]
MGITIEVSFFLCSVQSPSTVVLVACLIHLCGFWLKSNRIARCRGFASVTFDVSLDSSIEIPACEIFLFISIHKHD